MENNSPVNISDLTTQDQFTFRKPFLRLEQFLSKMIKIIFSLLLLAILSIFTVLVLNYFNIVPLSQKFPNYLFDLPHQEFTNQTQINLKLLNDPKLFSTSSNSWFINAKLFRVKNDTAFFYYKNSLISLKTSPSTTCGQLANRVTTGNGSSAGIEDIKCNEILSNNYKNRSYIIEYTNDDKSNFTILSTQLD